jgi:DNA-binding transcriptional ArsR family regulator
MLDIIFTVDDIARTRLAMSPLWEVVASVRVLKNPRPPAIHRRWYGMVRPRLASPEAGVRLLFDLVQPSTWYLPDFLSPAPRSPVPDLTAELAGVRGVPPAQVRADLDVLGHALTHPAGSLDEVTRPRRRVRRSMPASASPLVTNLYADPARGLELLAHGISAYWRIAIEPWWGRIRAALEGDLLFRGRQLGQGGHALLFGDLAPQVAWRDGALHIRHRRFSGRRELRGEGLLLVPSAFVWPSVFSSTIPPWQPNLSYPARGVAALWLPEPVDAPGAVGRVLGRSRARLLAHLESPTSTTELAARTGLTPGGVSQHLGALHDAGLVTPHRVGRTVLYARTALAEPLLALGNN